MMNCNNIEFEVWLYKKIIHLRTTTDNSYLSILISSWDFVYVLLIKIS